MSTTKSDLQMDNIGRNNTDNASETESAVSVVDYAPSISSYDDQGDDVKSITASLKNVGTTFFSSHIRETRKQIVKQMLLVILMFGVFCCTIITLYFGATYKTSQYYHKIHIIAVVQDDIWDNSTISMPALTAVIPSLIAAVPGTWHIYNTTAFEKKFEVQNDKINHRINKLIYDEKFWVAVNIKPNITSTIYNSLVDSNAPAFNSSDMLQVIYESGRDATNAKSSIVPLAYQFEAMLQNYYTSNYLPNLISNIVEKNFTLNHKNLAAAGQMLFGDIDYRPLPDRSYLSPTQVGIIYCLLLSIFQFMLMSPVHIAVAKVLNPKHYVFYRILASFGIFFFASLLFCTVSAIYQMNFTRTFGRAGFVIYWMSTWLFMMAVGGLNENVIGVIFSWKPQILGFWISSFVILNLAPTFFPMALDSVFYRYGYAMPVYNASAIFRVIFLDISKHRMGRNYGILVAWIALNTFLLPFSLKLIARNHRAAAKAAAKAAAEEAAEESAKEADTAHREADV